MHDDCPELKYRQFEIHLSDGNDPHYLFDKRTHTYVFHIHYCPFCGKAL